ncbi:MAG: hypothetical protein QOE08_2341 [Thermoleophilaceae bacterium]|jgi:hypothetical protein|nr:hypothetical protein [Thermoleophilaceae bacterium]
MRRLKNFSIAAAMGIMLAVGAPAAFAQQGSANDGYGEPAGLVQTQVGTSGEQPAAQTKTPASPAESPATTTVSDNGGKLPFTGLDIALMVGVGGLLLLLGFGMRRLTRPTSGGIA